MAVELRCPDCRAKLRLPHAPEADSEIECPKCGIVFAAEDNRVFAGDENEDVKAAKKKPAADEKAPGTASPAPEGGKPAAAKDQKGDKKVADKPFKRKKRQAKKKKTNPVVLWSVVGGGVLVLLFLLGILFYLFGRKTPTQEMMSYMPDDCDLVYGLNLGHMQKYPEFYKECEKMFASNGFKKAVDAFTKAVGGENIVEFVMQGEGKSGEAVVEATVFRTKSEFEPSKLVNLPGAKEYSAKGVKYYTIDDIPDLKYGAIRVFAPNNRVVVFCRDSIPESKFNAMLTGNKENPEGGIFHRAGPLVKAVTRGTAWKLVVYGRSVPKPEPPGPRTDTKGGSTQPNDEDNLKKEIADILGPSKGMGFKASVGSRDVRGEWVVWCKDSDASSALAKKWKGQEWVKDDEKIPPRWWTTLANKSGGGKTASNALKDGLGFRSSGELFSVRSSLETKVLQVQTLVTAFTGQQRSGGMGGGMPGGPGGPGGRPGGGPGPGSGPGGPGGGGPGGPGGGPGGPGGGPGGPGGGPGGPGGGPGGPGGMPPMKN